MTSPSNVPSISAFTALIRPELMFLEMVALLPIEAAVDGWRVVRILTLWFSLESANRVGLFEDSSLELLEVRILQGRYDESIRNPLAVIVGTLHTLKVALGAENRLAYACMCAAEWAASRHAHRVMLGFATFAAEAAGTDQYRMVAELARLNVELAEMPPEDQRLILETRRRVVVRRISELGGDVRIM